LPSTWAGYIGLGEDVQRAVAEVFERWDGRGLPRHLRDEAIAVSARVVSVAFDAILFNGLGGVDGAVSVVRKRAGGKYDPDIARAFCRHATQLLSDSDVGSAWEATLAAEPDPPAWLAASQFETAIRAIGAFADLLSPHFAGHSSGVGELASTAAGLCGLPTSDRAVVRLAGFVHDIGRAGISASIWNKPGPLRDTERERVRLHTYYTERVLARAPGLAARIRGGDASRAARWLGVPSRG
jgi:HD-GYP domain-containing protein (c-di-GMP phosphodiesterase class II)